MKISELEAKLKDLREEHGDLDCTFYDSVDAYEFNSDITNIGYQEKTELWDECIILFGEYHK